MTDKNKIQEPGKSIDKSLKRIGWPPSDLEREQYIKLLDKLWESWGGATKRHERKAGMTT